ncbi:hypothetical protein ADT25_11075 [Xanthomonas oryzae]|uniref:Uncharacterized protein n=1 Tax=Xanthomonas oryzae TaxID=347 RepID=A0AAP0ZLZ7_9XANT|nr:hypothetical protein [Xanthomonas oryzae]KOR44290.1 hypothetical protein ADT25_11075 [Xanthomonas oryzae]QBG85832.1 hypothetical protein EYR27_21205 [Xanthomonas oryzae]
MTVITDALAPYALIVRLVLWGVLAGGVLVSGCRYGERTATDAAAAQVRNAQASAGRALAMARTCGQRLTDVSAQSLAAERRAAKQQAVVEAAARQAMQDAALARVQATSAARALQAAKATPTCAAQLAMPLCPEIPVL